MTTRTRGLWRARILVELSHGANRFNTLGRQCGVSDPCALSRILKKLQAEGAVLRVIDSVGPPTMTHWSLTEYGCGLVGPAKALIASTAKPRTERIFTRSRPKIGNDPVGFVAARVD